MARLLAPLLALAFATTALLPLAAPDPGSQGWHTGRNDYTITMDDGVTLDASMVVPAGTQEGAQLPAIIAIHGYGGSKDVGTATLAANRGYVGFAYSTRGFGDSKGEMDVAGPRSMQDLKELVAWLKQNAPVAPDKVGVFGCSYGGGHSLQAATMPDMGIATAVPCVPWSDLAQALAPNNVFKLSYTTGFYLTGNGLVQSGCQPMCLDVAGVDLGRRQLYDTYDPEVHVHFVEAATGIGWGDAQQWLNERSAKFNVQNIHIPIFIIQGLSDDLFPADQALPFFQLIPSPEKKLYLGYVGHPRASGSGPEVDYVEGEAFQWFDYFLKGQGEDPVDRQHPIEVGQQPWTGKTLHLAGWPGGETGALWHLDADGTLAPTAGAAGVGAVANDGFAGIPDDPIVPDLVPPLKQVPAGTAADTLTFRSAKLAQPMELLGTPRADLRVLSTGTEYQVAVKIFDTDPATGGSVLVTRGIQGVPNNLPGQKEHVVFDLQPYRHTFPAGHQVEVRVASSDFPAYEPTKTPFVNVFDLGEGGSAIRLPFAS